MIILYNASFDWSKKSRGRMKRTSCLPENKTYSTYSEISGFFILMVLKSRYENTMWTNRIKSEILNKFNYLYI